MKHLILIFLACLLSSCLEVREEVWIDSSGGGRMQFDYTLPTQVIAMAGGEEGLREEIKSLKSIIKTLELQMSSYGENASKLSKLQRELNIKRDLYDDILIRFEKASKPLP